MTPLWCYRRATACTCDDVRGVLFVWSQFYERKTTIQELEKSRK